MMKLGFHHNESVVLIYFLQACLIVAAILLRYHKEWLLLSGYLIFSNLVLVGFYVAEKTGWKISRFDVIDRVVKGRLKGMIETGLLIKICFQTVEFGLPLLLLFTSFIPAKVSIYFQILAVGLIVILVLGSC